MKYKNQMIFRYYIEYTVNFVEFAYRRQGKLQAILSSDFLCLSYNKFNEIQVKISFAIVIFRYEHFNSFYKG